MRPARAAAALLCVSLAGCASTGAFRAGERAEQEEDYDRAVLEYSRALKLSPDDLDYRKSLARARERAAGAHAAAGRRLVSRGLYKEATDELRLALDLEPASEAIAADLRQADVLRQGAPVPPSIEELKDRSRERGLSGLTLPASAREPLGLSFRNASLRETYQALGRAAGVNVVFDPQFQDQTITIDLKDAPFEQALSALATVGHTFHRVSGGIITVVSDTPTKRREYEQQVVKTLFLSNADVKDTLDLLRVVLGARRVAAVPGANAISINDEPDKVAAAERLVEMVDKKRAEVVVEVEILEVNRGKLKDYGIEITSGTDAGGIAGAAFPDFTDKQTLKDNPYTRGNILITSLPGVIYRLLRTDSHTRLLANPQLRTSDGVAAQARFGDQVPVPVTVFTPLSQGGLAQQPVTSFEYKNVGVNIDITPRVHHDGEVSLALKLDISSLGPPGFQSIPTFNSRQVASLIRLKDGETNILAGLISDAERRSYSGLPGLSSLPVLGRIFGRNHAESQQTDIVMTLTPHIVRPPLFTEEDLRSFPVGGDAAAPPLFELPGSLPSYTTPAPAPTPAPRITPIPAPSPITPPGA